MKSIFVALLLVGGSAFAAEELQTSISLETTFQDIMSKPNPDKEVRTNYLEGLLNSSYRIDARIDEFEKNLDQLVERAKQDPDFVVNPLDSDAYQQIMSGTRVSAQLSKQITYIYKRLLQTASDPKSSADLIAKATAALQEIDNYFKQLPDEDRIEFGDLLEELRDLRDRASGDYSASSDLPGEEESNYENFKAKVTHTAAKRKLKSSRAFQKSTPALEYAIASEQDMVENAGHGFTQIHPSPGPDGNVIGTEFAKGVWALTFDDGPHPSYSPQLMDALRSHKDKINQNGAPASFFWLAMNVKLYPNIVQKAISSGFSTNCHSWTHANLAKSSSAVRAHEVTDAVNFERKAYGRNFKFFRCPYGACFGPPVPEVRQMLSNLGLVHAYWSVDSLDWKLKDAARTLTMVQKQMKVQRHGVVLMHDIHPYSLEAAKMLLNWIKTQNDSGADAFYLYTLDDAVWLRNHNLVAGAKAPNQQPAPPQAPPAKPAVAAPAQQPANKAAAIVAPLQAANRPVAAMVESDVSAPVGGAPNVIPWLANRR